MTAKRKPVEAWAWAVVAPESDTLIFWDPVGAMDAAAEVDGGEVIDLVPRTERSPAEAAVIRDLRRRLRELAKIMRAHSARIRVTSGTRYVLDEIVRLARGTK
jgi:hypothetical protein